MHACMQMIGTHGAEKHPKPQMRYHHFNNLKLTQRNLEKVCITLYCIYTLYIPQLYFTLFQLQTRKKTTIRRNFKGGHLGKTFTAKEFNDNTAFPRKLR